MCLGAKLEGVFATENSSAQAAVKLKDFETMFLALVTKYAKMLPTKLGELSTAIKKPKLEPGNRELVAEVRAIAHKIKGTGGSLGFRQVGEAMAFIEAAAVAMPDRPEEEQPMAWAEIDQKLLEAQHVGELEAKEVAEFVTERR